MAHLQNIVHSTLGEPLTITGDSIDGAALVTLEAHMPEGLLDLSPTVARQLSALLLEAALAAEAHLEIEQAS